MCNYDERYIRYRKALIGEPVQHVLRPNRNEVISKFYGNIVELSFGEVRTYYLYKALLDNENLEFLNPNSVEEKLRRVDAGELMLEEDEDDNFDFPPAFLEELPEAQVNGEKSINRVWMNKMYVMSYLHKRGIEYFVHFTKVENLPSILEHGICSVESMQEGEITFNNNDMDRFDNRNDAISLSISFPNYRVFYTFRTRYPDSNWAVLMLDPAEVLKCDCAFFATNAASAVNIGDDWSEHRWVRGLERLFEDPRSEDIPDSYTSNPQAEVMVRGIINAKAIKQICFSDYEIMRPHYPLVEATDIELRLNSALFRPRRDYRMWSEAAAEEATEN